MRPIIKGDWPQDNGANKVYAEYGEARPELIIRLGDYCSYCENQITNPAVEHEQPKIVAPGLELNWYNYLLSCINCNSTKGHEYLNFYEYYWPDVHNTHLLFDYLPLGYVVLKNEYPADIDKGRAERTYNLVGLGRYKSQDHPGDRRWEKRSQAWGDAESVLKFYEGNGLPDDFIPLICRHAKQAGFWSVWMSVFRNHPEVQDALILAFNGTFPGCRTTDINRL